MQSIKEKLLLHACCAPCAAHVISSLSRAYAVTAFFYNPNIQPESEYRKRLQDIERFCVLTNTPLWVPEYDVQPWLTRTKGLEGEPEGGGRCTECFRLRLAQTVQTAVLKEIPFVATTLTTSPHKKARVINTLGRELARESGMRFLEADFKKNDGFKKSCALSRCYGFYRQRYCGCLLSQRNHEGHE